MNSHCSGCYILNNPPSLLGNVWVQTKDVFIRSIRFKLLFWKPPHICTYKWCYYRQTIFDQLNIMVPHVDIVGLCHSFEILWEIYVSDAA